MSKNAARLRRKKLRADAMAQLAILADDQLVNLRHELGREIGLQAKHINELRLRLEGVRVELERRSTITKTGIHISDHAVVRYLERVKGVDVTAMRDEIAEIALRARSTTNPNPKGRNGRRIDGVTGLTLGVDEETTVVTTIFDDKELPVMKVVS